MANCRGWFTGREAGIAGAAGFEANRLRIFGGLWINRRATRRAIRCFNFEKSAGRGIDSLLA